jgi:hypothetical protein
MDFKLLCQTDICFNTRNNNIISLSYNKKIVSKKSIRQAIVYCTLYHSCFSNVRVKKLTLLLFLLKYEIFLYSLVFDPVKA